jgi:hypothetical protein
MESREAVDRAVKKAAQLSSDGERPWLEEYRKSGALR